MFKKKEPNTEDFKKNIYEQTPVSSTVVNQKINTLLKGSKLSGDIIVSYDLELNGEVEGNITSEKSSNIIIKGICRGNIKTDEGSVNIDGEFSNGDIISGGDVKITGKFNGGKIEAKGKIYINGEFNGKLQGNEIEIGNNAMGNGEILYKEYISIAKGAKVGVQISQIKDEFKVEKMPDAEKFSDMNVVFELPVKGESEITIH